MLDRALGINQTLSINYIERTNKFFWPVLYGKLYLRLNKQLNPMGQMRRGGGMMRIIR